MSRIRRGVTGYARAWWGALGTILEMIKFSLTPASGR